MDLIKIIKSPEIMMGVTCGIIIVITWVEGIKMIIKNNKDAKKEEERKKDIDKFD